VGVELFLLADDGGIRGARGRTGVAMHQVKVACSCHYEDRSNHWC